MARREVLIEITSDTVCPWCYVGKRRLERAMRQHQDRLSFTVRWLPFQLAPEAPAQGLDKLQYYKDKFGAARVEQMIPHMAQVFAGEGLSYSIGGLTGNTLDSHRLIEWAGQQAPHTQDALVEELFNNYFCQEKFINDRGVLLAAAAKVGLSGAAEYLADPAAGRDSVLAAVARARGIGGVPYFVIDKRFKISGAQDSAVFADLFEQLASSGH